MTSELLLRRKWTLRVHGKQVVFVKRPVETVEHVLMKAFLWGLYLPDYPDLTVEARVGDRYKPDVLGGIVAYSNQIKQALLHVRPGTLIAHGAVSEETAQEMAVGAQAALGVDVAVSITGIAGPVEAAPRSRWD